LPKKRKANTLLFLCFAIVAFLSVMTKPCAPPLTTNPTLRLTLLLSGILQGNLLPWRDSESGERKGGAAWLAKSILDEKAIAKNEGRQTILLDSGDDLTGSIHSYFTNGKAVIEFLNILAPDVFVPGNREFDRGRSICFERMKEARFPIVATNMELKADPYGETVWKKRTVLEKGGKKILIAGVVPPSTVETTKAENVEGLIFKNLSETSSELANLDRIEKPDLFILVTQFDIAEKDYYVKALETSGVDILTVLDFSKNSTRYENGALRADSMILVPADGLARGGRFTRVDIDFTADMRPADIKTKIVDVMTAKGPPDDSVGRLVSETARRVSKITRRKIGRANERLSRPYARETALGDLVTDALREAASVEVAFVNSTAIRADLAGDITVGDLYESLPFENDLVTMTLPGSAIRDILEFSVARKHAALQISGGTYEVLTGANGERKLGAVEIAGSPLEAGRIYRLATDDFLARGGDGYVYFRGGKDLDTGSPIRDVVETHIIENSPLEKPSGSRIVERNPDAASGR
jgi:2',3'-cyclic-nucleotide 2'-phosphodiesterase (5'-nucleotidase family)